MNTVLLQYAVEVEKTGSITQAAANLYMEQPNLSKAIKTLEESLGAPIFKRTSKGVVPTARGRIFLEHARSVLVQIDEMEHLYKTDQENGVEFSLSMPRASYLSAAFSRFIYKIGGENSMNVWLRETNSADTIGSVETGEYNLGIIRYQSGTEKFFEKEIGSKGLSMEPVFEYAPRLLMSKEHPLSGKEEITPGDLIPFVEIVHGDGIRSRREETGKKGETEFKKRIYVFERGSQFDLLWKNPNTYMWVSPMPSEILCRYQLVEYPCKKNTKSYCDYLIYRKGYSLSDWDKEFLYQLDEVKGEWAE
ncbi:LysR family transcriptional regulator [Clostridium sp. E02]|uniref:LysR family transcriptional regulator n=1 Tax=Clostridium sp. E02 TaxID=2487134 RepID=UPI000F52143F|nr:LysR family transcriptional regulator [Clostridium sp. E02]